MRRLSLFILFLLFAFPAQAEAPSHVKARLFSPATATGGAKEVPLALELTMSEGWKSYWRMPGDAGTPPAFDWTESENLAQADILFPVPERFVAFELDNFGYHDTVILPIHAVLNDTQKPLSARLKLDILVCSDICVPERHDLSFNLPAGASAASPEAALYEEAQKRLPKRADVGITFESAWLEFDNSNRALLGTLVTMAGAPGRDADLFIEHESGIVFGKPEIRHDRDTGRTVFLSPAHATLPAETLATDLRAGKFRLTFAESGSGAEGYLALGEKPENLPAEKIRLADQVASLDLRILLLALLGGLILNLMPCVLPVLSLKILSVVSHGGKDSRRVIFRNFMASAAGIVFSFWLMALVVAILKSAGETVGWGIQFQHPAFLVFLIGVLLLFAVNLWGVFEIPLPRFIARHAATRHEHEPTLLGHFLTGAFATLLATPCTAPFLGTAIGFALAGSLLDVFAVFTFLGLGLALPYIALALSPRLFRLMPKPGAWMIRLKKILAVALLATALWLGNVLMTITTMPALDAGWEKFDQALISPAVAEGKVVIVDVTADWCLTCKANKRFVLEKREIIEAMSGENILRLQADWTTKDEAIAAYLRSFGRYGIPFNAVYGPAAPEGLVLPELLTRRAVMNALAEAAGE